MWLWRVVWVLCCSMAASIQAFVCLYVSVCGVVGEWWGGSCAHLAPGWAGRPSAVASATAACRVSMRTSSIPARAAAAGEGSGARFMTLSVGGGERRALHDPIGLLIVALDLAERLA